MLRFCLILLVLLSNLAVASPANAAEFTISTDKSVYYVGETITIFIEPAPAIGMNYWLIIQKPDGSQTRGDLRTGEDSVTIVAGPPPGSRTVQLWGQAVSPTATPQLFAEGYYEVRQPTPPAQFRIWAEKQSYYYGDSVIIHIQPAPAIGVSYWLLILKPDGSQMKADLGTGQDIFSIVAGPPPGERRVELWGQTVSPGSTPEQYAECAYEVREQESPTQFTIWTDKPVYYYGEPLTVHIQPAPELGVNYWLIIQKPDGSQDRMDLAAGQGTVAMVAGPPYGQYQAELWGQAVAQNAAPRIFASCQYGVKEQTPVTTRTQHTTKTESTTTRLTSTTIQTVASTTTQTVASTVTETATGRCLLRTGDTCVLPCLVATAAYGSEMAPEVVYMRYVRDDLIGSTSAGMTLVAGFNAFYYSWSPAVAGAIAGNELLRATFRILLMPLVLIVHVTALLFDATAQIAGRPDVASVVAFIAAASMATAVYVALPIFAGRRLMQAFRKRRP